MAKKEVSIDNTPYEWDEDSITGAQLRELGGIPEGVQLFRIVPSSPDKIVELDTVIDLNELKGIDRFSTDSAASGAG